MSDLILIVEDEAVLRESLTRILISAGYSVAGAGDGEEAAAFLATQPVALVITDLLMPIKDGTELIRHITENYPETQCMVITAYPSAESAIEALNLGVAHYFKKPFSLEEFVACVNRVMEKQRGRLFSWEALDVTRKERQLLRLFMEEGVSSNQELAERMEIKVTTVKQHFENLFEKFGVKNRVSLIFEIMKQGKIDLKK